MRGLFEMFASENDARGEAVALSDDGWNVILAGPHSEGFRILQDGDFVANFAGGWAVLASKGPLQQP